MKMEIPRYWRTTHQRMRLLGEICTNGHKLFPPRDVCLDCVNQTRNKPIKVEMSVEIVTQKPLEQG